MNIVSSLDQMHLERHIFARIDFGFWQTEKVWSFSAPLQTSNLPLKTCPCFFFFFEKSSDPWHVEIQPFRRVVVENSDWEKAFSRRSAEISFNRVCCALKPQKCNVYNSENVLNSEKPDENFQQTWVSTYWARSSTLDNNRMSKSGETKPEQD